LSQSVYTVISNSLAVNRAPVSKVCFTGFGNGNGGQLFGIFMEKLRLFS
jgi:hypothetical protein